MLERQHGRVPGGQVCVIGMGKLGGHEMTASSDLDLILIYDHDPGAYPFGRAEAALLDAIFRAGWRSG